ncbi:MAG: two-CW domain-containing protein [Candidatus Hermodarchaeota archaeon]
MKKNCWEVKNCGREENGNNIESLGICPASTEAKLNAIHDGRNAGRCCWIVSGTLCESQVQGTFAQKYKDCFKCDFYNLVKNEEGGKFKLSNIIIQNLK